MQDQLLDFPKQKSHKNTIVKFLGDFLKFVKILTTKIVKHFIGITTDPWW